MDQKVVVDILQDALESAIEDTKRPLRKGLTITQNSLAKLQAALRLIKTDQERKA